MNLLEITMLIIGALIILFSCIYVGKNSYEKNTNEDLYNQDNLATIKERQNDILSSISEEVILKTEDYLSKLSNEKIMAVSEFSDQIIEKINRNHEEVVFLYNMLSNKEKELKEVIKVFDESQKRAKELLVSKQLDDVQEETTVKSKSIDGQANSLKTQTEEYSHDLAVEPAKDLNNTDQSVSINNAEILKLSSQGKSIMEISKQLGIGQGEVKLVIDLFKNK